MLNQTQEAFVVNHLKEKGFILSNQLYYNNLTTSLKSLNKDQIKAELDKQLTKILINLQIRWESNAKIMEVKTAMNGTYNEIKLACIKKYEDYIEKA